MLGDYLIKFWVQFGLGLVFISHIILNNSDKMIFCSIFNKISDNSDRLKEKEKFEKYIM